MSTSSHEQLRRAMAEAVALPTDDPARREVLARVREAGDWAQAEWVELVELDERLRMQLSRVEVPEGLERRLLAIPGETAEGAGRSAGEGWRWGVFRRRSVVAAMAAAVLLGALLAVLFLSVRSADSRPALMQIAELAVADHRSGSALTIQSTDPDTVYTALADASPLAVQRADLGPRYRLEGGRACKFDDLPVVLTRWDRDGRPHSLYQFHPEHFGMPDRITRQDLWLTNEGDRGATHTAAAHRVIVWVQDGEGFALVCEEEDPLATEPDDPPQPNTPASERPAHAL